MVTFPIGKSLVPTTLSSNIFVHLYFLQSAFMCYFTVHQKQKLLKTNNFDFLQSHYLEISDSKRKEKKGIMVLYLQVYLKIPLKHIMSVQILHVHLHQFFTEIYFGRFLAVNLAIPYLLSLCRKQKKLMFGLISLCAETQLYPIISVFCTLNQLHSMRLIFSLIREYCWNIIW